MKSIIHLVLVLIICFSCVTTTSKGQANIGRITPAAERIELYLPQIIAKKVGLIVNQTSTVKGKHLVDYLSEGGVNVQKIFTPEHGFRGTADAGEKVDSEKDETTGVDIVSLYGKKKKPTPEDISDLDILIFDIQDVGVRFYTYISTLHYVLEAAAENNIPVIVLDRPNPLSRYVDGPILEPEYKSFVGMHPVPVVYGMTIGEYALMINGEGWLANGIEAKLEVIPIDNFTHDSTYILPIKPSPNLPNSIAIGHYPSLCFFEGTTVSVGRGTDAPFQQIGHPKFSQSDFSFTPKSGPGAKYPKLENKECIGLDLRRVAPDYTKLDLGYLIKFYENLSAQEQPFFLDSNFFNLLAGTDQLKKMIIAQVSESEIRAMWEPGLIDFKLKRKKYLLYD